MIINESVKYRGNNENLSNAWIAFLKMQMPPFSKREKVRISEILKNDLWWQELDERVHKSIGRIIRNRYDDFCSKSPIDIHYRPVLNSVGEYEADCDKRNHTSKEYLYHYTDISGFLGIIGGTIRLSNSATMNDKLESKHYLDSLFAASKSLLDSPWIPILDNLKEDYKTLYSTPTYLMSFTENEDDAAQWERYASGGEGVCVVFDKKALEIIAARRFIQLKYVSYPKEYQFIPDVEDMVRYVSDGILPRGIRSEEIFFNYIGCQSTLFKHPSFKSERECRMYYATNRFERNPSGLVREDGRDGRIREFYEFEWIQYTKKEGLSMEDVVPMVILGPKSKVDKGILERRLAKGEMIWKGRIEDSSCPLR